MSRYFTTVPANGGQWNNHYAIRGNGESRILCADMRLTWDQADRLCDVLEGVRQRALDLEFPTSRKERAA